MSKNLEIERKFLIKGEYKALALNKTNLKQGYLSTDPERTVRVRVKDKTGYITIKGSSNPSGMSRFEWEKEIDYNEAIELLKLCKEPVIDKTRYIIQHEKHIIEVDEFYGANKGLVLAEIELENENDFVNLPDYIGAEVTGDKRYYNSYLSQNPFNNWR